MTEVWIYKIRGKHLSLLFAAKISILEMLISHMEIQYVIIKRIGETISKGTSTRHQLYTNILNKIIENMTYSIIWYKTGG